MSKERARRRAAREHEAALRAAARAADQERRERRAARAAAVRRVTTGRLPTPGRGRQTGVLARRRSRRTGLLLAFLLAVQVVVWVVRPDWETRLAALVVSLLVAPVLGLLVLGRR